MEVNGRPQDNAQEGNGRKVVEKFLPSKKTNLTP